MGTNHDKQVRKEIASNRMKASVKEARAGLIPSEETDGLIDHWSSPNGCHEDCPACAVKSRKTRSIASDLHALQAVARDASGSSGDSALVSREALDLVSEAISNRPKYNSACTCLAAYKPVIKMRSKHGVYLTYGVTSVKLTASDLELIADALDVVRPDTDKARQRAHTLFCSFLALSEYAATVRG